MSGCLYFMRYWAIRVLQQPGCDGTNFEINLAFLIKAFSLYDQKIKRKAAIC